jgi:TetR/AcrR family transcriptional regulator
MGRPRSDIRSRIVHAARAAFLADGVDGASLRTIASQAGSNLGMVFYYFPTKDDLLFAVVEEVYAAFLTDLNAVLSGGADDAPVKERLRRAFTRLGRASDDELAVLRLVVSESLLSSARFERIFTRVQRGHLAMFVAELQRGVKAGEIDPSIPTPLLLLATLGLGGVAQLVRRMAGKRAPFAGLPSAEALADASTELLFRAIGAAPRRRLSRSVGPASPRSGRERR